MRTRRVVAAVVFAWVFARGAPAEAQHCPTSTGELAIVVSGGWINQATAGGIDDWELGTRVEWTPNILVTTRALYRQESLNRRGLHVAALGAATDIAPIPGNPCLTFDVMLALGHDLEESDQYRNISIPIGIVFAR